MGFDLPTTVKHTGRQIAPMSEISLTEIEIVVDAEDERVVSWRAEELIRAGYDELDALELAFERQVDLHRAIDLLQRGCPPKTAVRILL